MNHSQNNLNLALFDFDGTITTKDTLLEFIKFSKGNIKFMLGMIVLSPLLIAYKLKLLPNYKAKEYMLSYFFKGIKKDKFQKIAKDYALNEIKYILREDAIKKIEWHKKRGDKVIIISASMECWIKPWCEMHNIELIGTKLEFLNNRFSGKFLTKNCYGIQKVLRLKELYDIDKFKYIYAYGDSKGDREMLSLANESYYKPFR